MSERPWVVDVPLHRSGEHGGGTGLVVVANNLTLLEPTMTQSVIGPHARLSLPTNQNWRKSGGVD